MTVERLLALLPGLLAVPLLVLVVVRARHNRRQGRDWYLQPNQVKAVGDLLPTVSGVMMGFTASIIIYSLNIESADRNTVLIRFNVRNTAVLCELITFVLIFASMILALYIKSRSFYDVGFPADHRFEESEFAREESRRTLEFLSALTVVTYALAISCLLLGLNVAASPYLDDGLVEAISWFPLFALIAVVPLAYRLLALPARLQRLAGDVRVELAGSAGCLEGRIAAWPVHPRRTSDSWSGVLALFTDADYAALRDSYLRQQRLRIALAAQPPAGDGSAQRAGQSLEAYVEAMDLPGRPLRARLAGAGELPGVPAPSTH